MELTNTNTAQFDPSQGVPITYLEVPRAQIAYAIAHGARREPSTGNWFVPGNVPPELAELVPMPIRPRSLQQGPSCPKCGSPMVERSRKRDGAPFWGCTQWRGTGCNGVLSSNYADDVHISKAIHRAMTTMETSTSLLAPDVKDLPSRMRHVFNLALEKCGAQATSWFNTPKVALQQKTPIQVLNTMQGCDQLEKLLIELNK